MDQCLLSWILSTWPMVNYKEMCENSQTRFKGFWKWPGTRFLAHINRCFWCWWGLGLSGQWEALVTEFQFIFFSSLPFLTTANLSFMDNRQRVSGCVVIGWISQDATKRVGWLLLGLHFHWITSSVGYQGFHAVLHVCLEGNGMVIFLPKQDFFFFFGT